ncbi:MAG TPA: EVE domain-containing protein [Geothrix sp.]|nr:EVE domain-containing protein [Geothrix sp.]
MSRAPFQTWIAVASAEHVRLGRAQGFMQVCHGKEGPLRRMRPGDVVIYYSPSERMGGGARIQAFTAIGRVKEGDPYAVQMGAEFRPFRKEVAWMPASETPIVPLLPRLSFTAGQRNWGAKFRFGVFKVDAEDGHLIAGAMGCQLADPMRLDFREPSEAP